MMRTAARLHGVRLWWACGFTFVMLLNLDQFGAASGLGPQPKYWAVGIFVVSLVMLLPNLRGHKLMHSPLTWWTAGYFVCSAAWILRAQDREAAMFGLSMVVTTGLYAWTALLTYPLIETNARLWGITLWLALLVAVASVLLEYFVPSIFLFSDAGRGIFGRAAGLYLNPNIAAQTILMILACLLMRNAAWASLSAALVALPALLLTFSRAGMVGWLVLIMVAAVRGHLPRLALVAIMGTGAAIIVAGPTLLEAASAWIAPENRNSLDRLAWILGQGGLADYAATEREWVAGFAWDEFLASPLFGHGLGYMWVWSAGIGSHNMILRHIVEYGVLGFLIFPLFLCCSIWSANAKKVRSEIWPVAAIVFMLGFFSHNLLEQGCLVFPWLASCLMPSPAARIRQ